MRLGRKKFTLEFSKIVEMIIISLGIGAFLCLLSQMIGGVIFTLAMILIVLKLIPLIERIYRKIGAWIMTLREDENNRNHS